LSKVEANKMELLAEDIDIALFLHETAGTMDALVSRKNNKLEVDCAADIGSMRTDAVKLRQCLFNLLGNAAKFTENGTISLTARREMKGGVEHLSFAISDDGIGMTQEQVSRLFQRFTQGDETTTRKFGGTGLGLALSKAFARLMGGDISVQSESGCGTIFTITIPAVLPERAAEPTEEPIAPHAGEDGRGALVLVIDDEASQRELLTRFLQRQGFNVRVAADGEKGIELARLLRPRAVLLDVMMPGIDGWAVLRTLKADEATRDIPVVMVSFVADAALSSSLGATDSVSKPIDWRRLQTVLAKLDRTAGDVLVVDDDASMRERLRSILERNGWAVGEAADGAEALERVRAKVPQLVLLDLTMPVMDGFTFLEKLRRLPEGTDVPVLVLTARDLSSADRERLHDASAIMRKGEAGVREISMEVQRLTHR
jgi:CheY-like chemotaxis protein/two-component sensor histidine kinase